jgi:hypothetical protein
MKTNRFSLIKSSMLLVLLLASTIITTLNSCTVTEGVSYQTYTPPAWAPPYDDVSSVHYYYFPDYDMYYDVWADQFWYNDNGAWIPSASLPLAYANVDLNNAYIVLINKKYATPWVRHDYFVKNYPPHVYDNYQNIVVTNRIVKNVQPNHDLVPRAYNENTNRVTFMQREHQPTTQPQQNQQNNNNQWNNRQPVQNQPVQNTDQQPINRQPSQPTDRHQSQDQPTQPQQTNNNRQPVQNQPVQNTDQQPINRQPSQPTDRHQSQDQPTQPQQNNNNRQPVQNQPVQNQPVQNQSTVQQPINRQQPQSTQNNSATPAYHRVSQEVPMKSIRPYLPQQSQNTNRRGPN